VGCIVNSRSHGFIGGKHEEYSSSLSIRTCSALRETERWFLIQFSNRA
jgi:hypothetical protein